jgi:hypothetical protein
MQHWKPKGSGTQFEWSPILAPLEPFRSQTIIVEGLAQKPAINENDGNGEHARAGTVWLSAVRPKRTEGADVYAGVTMDQIAARELGRDTPLPSLELAIEPTYMSGNCDNGYACVYSNTFVWKTPTMPLPMENNPRVVFERLFGDGGSKRERIAAMHADQSLLDELSADINRLNGSLGPTDRTTVNEYLESIRDVERRIQRAAEQDGDALESLSLERPVGIPDNYDEHAKLMFDLQLLALRADITRVITFQLGREFHNRSYAFIGVPDGHHSLSHHQNDPERLLRLSKINTYHISLMAGFLEKLRSTRDGDGTLLDHSLLLYGSGISDSNLHTHTDLPIAVFGGDAGTVKGGRYVQFPLTDEVPMANLMLGILDSLGIPLDSLGDSTEHLELNA